jgi:ribosome-associated protein
MSCRGELHSVSWLVCGKEGGVTINSEQIALEAAKSLDAKQAHDIRIFDVRGLSSVTDFYLVATGTSAPHLKALIAETQRRMKELGVSSFRTSGEPDSGWVVVDYVHAVVHVFSPEARAYYAIEKLWSTAKELPFQQG